MESILQVALDFLDLPRALKVAEEAVAGGADWLEAGTPLIKSEGLEAVRALRKKYPKKVIVADMKIIDTGRIEVEAAAKAGANVVGVLGEASAATIRECIEAARNYGAKIMVDLIECPDVVGRAKEAEALGAHFLGVHAAIDVQMQGLDPFKELREVSRAVSIPVSVAGGINSETAAEAVRAGATVVVVGGAIIKSADAKNAAAEIKKALRTGQKIETKLYKRGSAKNIREILEKVSASNVSDALHRGGEITGMSPVTKGLHMVGRALTVRTYAGDWAKPVQAIDEAKEGDVIVIDAGGAGPAVWGELATHSSLQKGLAGVVIDGAIRDTPEIDQLNFPAFTRLVTPAAGEPKGFGEIGVPVKIGGVRIFPGDWIVGDDDGLVVIPKEKAVEYANRAMDVLERENRLRREIQEKSTLSQVGYLKKWEKVGE